MSKISVKLSQAQDIARDLVKAFSPGCDRIEIAGSIRRKKPRVGDIEIVCIPTWQRDLFGEVSIKAPTALDHILYDLVAAGRLLPSEKNGPKFKQFILPDIEGLHMDLFLTTPECWGVIYTIRTGPAEFNMKLVLQDWQGGLLPKGHRIRGGRVLHHKRTLATPEEKDLFELIGGWIGPENRI